jgi:hypothetical protein
MNDKIMQAMAEAMRELTRVEYMQNSESPFRLLSYINCEQLAQAAHEVGAAPLLEEIAYLRESVNGLMLDSDVWQSASNARDSIIATMQSDLKLAVEALESIKRWSFDTATEIDEPAWGKLIQALSRLSAYSGKTEKGDV